MENKNKPSSKKEVKKDLPKAPSSPVCYAQSDELRDEYKNDEKEDKTGRNTS